MRLLNTRPGADPTEFRFALDSPDFDPAQGGMGYISTGGVGCRLLFPNLGMAGGGQYTFDCQIAFDNFFQDNTDPAHFIVQMRSDLEGVQTGRYRGHGPIIGNLWGQAARAMWESWGPCYGVPGGNVILPKSHSLPLDANQQRQLHRLTASSMLTASGYKVGRYTLGQIGQIPHMETGGMEDNNPDIDMESPALVLACHFAPKPDAHPLMAVRVINATYTRTDDSTPMPDLRGFQRAAA